MKKLIKCFGFAAIAAGMLLSSCGVLEEPFSSVQGDIILYIGFNRYPDDGFIFQDDSPLFVDVENLRNVATGEISIITEGLNPESFSVDPLTLDSIDIGDSDTFSITPNNASSGDNAEITLSGDGFSKTIKVYYKEKSGTIDKTIFYGKWSNSAGNNGTEISESIFRYFNTAGSTTVNVSSTIDSWQEVTWIVEGSAGNVTDVPNGAIQAMKLTCTIDKIDSYTNPGDYINSMFNILPRPSPQESGVVTVGKEFTVWILSADYANIKTAGIHIGLRNYNGFEDMVADSDRRNFIPWETFTFKYNYEAPDSGIALYDEADNFLPSKYYFLAEGEEGKLTVRILNISDDDTGDLEVKLSGDNAVSFTLGDLDAGDIVSGIPVDDYGSFTIIANGGLPNKIYKAKVTVSGANELEESFDLEYWAFKQEDFYGVFTNAGNRTLTIEEDYFKYYVPSGSGNPINVESEILSWEKTVWIINNSSIAATFPNGTVTAWKITGKVTTVTTYTPAPPMNGIYNLPNATASLTAGQEFTTWLVCKDPAAISGIDASTGGINISYQNYATPQQNCLQWVNFILQQ